jgi:hypothetical protein
VKANASRIRRSLSGWRERIVVADEPDLDARETEHLVRGKDQGRFGNAVMEHVCAHFGRRRHRHVRDHGLLAVHDFPIAWQHKVVRDFVHQRDNGLTSRERRHRAAVKTVAAIDDERVAGILPAQRVDHRAQSGQSAAPLVDGFSAFPEKLVVDLELRVDVAGVKNRDALPVAPADCQVLGRFRRGGRIALQPAGENRANTQTDSRQPDPLDEITAA